MNKTLAGTDAACVLSVNISEEKGTIKHPVPMITLNERGIEQDAHAGGWHRQISLLSEEMIKLFETEIGRAMHPGEFAENITLRGNNLRNISVLDHLLLGDAELEVTQRGKKCHGDGCAIFREVGKCVMPKEGIFCKVIKGGVVKPGDTITFIPRVLRFKIITMSDRASCGEYEDRSGPMIGALLEEFFNGTPWRTNVEAIILPDDAARLKTELDRAYEEKVDVIITTGGTGIGPRDITPEVVRDSIEKELPGVMEHIRVKYGSQKPNALLSRSVAGTKGRTAVFALPGSVNAVKEYMEEIFKILEHLIFMLNGLDNHGNR